MEHYFNLLNYRQEDDACTGGTCTDGCTGCTGQCTGGCKSGAKVTIHM